MAQTPHSPDVTLLLASRYFWFSFSLSLPLSIWFSDCKFILLFSLSIVFTVSNSAGLSWFHCISLRMFIKLILNSGALCSKMLAHILTESLIQYSNCQTAVLFRRLLSPQEVISAGCLLLGQLASEASVPGS